MIELPLPSSDPRNVIEVVESDALVRRVRAGDAAALEQLLAPQLDQAMRTARRLLHTREEAEDLVQQACLHVIEQLDRFTLGRPFGPWFHRVLTNLGLKRIAAAKVRETDEFDESRFVAETDPSRELEDAEVRVRFSKALEALSPRQRLIVFRFDVDGASGADIAAELGISPQTVRWHLHEARATLRERLSDLRPSTFSEE